MKKVLITSKKSFWLVLSITLLTLGFVSCSSDSVDSPEQIPEESTEADFSKVVANAGEFEDPKTSEELVEETETNEIIDGEVWNCTTKTYDALRGGGTGRDGFPLFNPNTSVIYPGSLLQGKSLKNATPDVIAVERAGGTISYNLNNGNQNSRFSVDKVAKSSIQDAMNNIIGSSPQDLPANFSFTYEQVQSREALALSMGVDFENAFTEVSADFDFSSEKEYNRILVELKQNFYTMSFDIPTSLKGIFADSVTPEDLAKYVQPGNPATYISDVSYGRIYYMLVESTSSYTEMNAAVEAEFKSVANKAEVDIDASYLNELSEIKIKVMAFGGESSSTIRTIGGNLSELVDLLAESSTISTGLPLSYVVRSVNTNQVVGVQLATKYDVTECEPAPLGGEPIYTAHWKGQVLSKLGPVGAAYSENNGTDFVLISIDGKKFMKSSGQELDGPYPIEELFDGEYPFGDEGIGAATNGYLNRYYFVSLSGQYVTFVRDGTWGAKLTTESQIQLGVGPPFLAEGIGAMLKQDEPRTEQEGFRNWSFSKNGDEYSLSIFYINTLQYHKEILDIGQWGSGELPLEKVGAGIGFWLSTEWPYRSQFKQYIMFDITGTQYYISTLANGYGGDGPYDL